MIFGGTWYCYETVGVEATAASIKDNACGAALGGDSGPVKITETREYGFMHNVLWNIGFASYVGLYRKNGATYVW